MTTGKKRIRRLLNLLISGYLILLGAWLILKVKRSASPPHPSPATVNLNELRKSLEDKYRLGPDRRFLLAVADIDHILTGRPRQETECRFKSKRWLLFYDDTAVGSLPELPSFADGLELLMTWTEKVAGSRRAGRADASSSDHDIDSDFWISESFAVVRDADKLWQQREYRQALVMACRALTNLSFQCPDYMEVSDQIPARALACLAVLKTYALADTTRQECLLATAMGYHNYAQLKAAELAYSDPVRLYVCKQDEKLKDEAEQGKSLATCFFYLKRLSEKYDLDRWQSWKQDYFMDKSRATLSVLATGLDMQSFEKQLTYSETIIAALPAIAVHNRTPSLSRTGDMSYLESVRALLNGRLCREIEAANQAIDHDLDYRATDGRFMDTSTLRNYYRAFLDASVYSIASHYLDRFPSGSGAQRFSECIYRDGTGRLGGLSEWYEHLVAAETRGQKVWALRSDLDPHLPLGPHANVRTLNEITRFVDFLDPAMFDAVKRIFSCMDTRPHHRGHAAAIAYKYLLDLELTKRLYQGAVDSGWDPNHIGPWFLVWTGNFELLQDSLNDPDLKLDRRIETLELLTRKSKEEYGPLAGRTYAALFNRYPDSWPVAAAYASFLIESGKLDSAERVLKSWLSTNEGAAGWDYLQAVSKLAELYYKQKKFQEGLACIRPIESSDLVYVQKNRALLLYGAGQKENALKVARQALKVHPRNVQALNLALRLAWRQGQYKEAADLIDSAGFQFGSSDCRAIAATFADVFADSPEKGVDALNAIAPLHKVSSLFYSTLALAADTEGHHHLAFAIASNAPVAAPEKLNFLISAYDYMTRWKNREAALKWLDKEYASYKSSNFPAGMKSDRSVARIKLGQSVHEYGQDDLLWRLYPADIEGSGSEYIWLLRAAHCLGSNQSPHKKELDAYFAVERPDKLLGRCLLGMVPESAITNIANEKGVVCKAAYFLGLKAESQSDYAGATNWFRLAVETGYPSQAERRWAYERLLSYQHSEMTLEELAKKGG